MIISAVFLTSGATASKECLRLLTKWPIRRMDAVDGSTIHGERASTLYTPSSTSSGWIPRWKSENPPGRQIAHSSLSRWGMSRSRRLRGWKNELPVLSELHTPRPTHPTHRFQRPDLQGAGIVQNWSGSHNFWVSCLSSNGKM